MPALCEHRSVNVITSDEEHERMLAEVEKLMDKSEHRSAEEDAALDLMVRLVKDYEAEHHPLEDPSPHEMLVYLMEQRNLKQADLLPIFKSRIIRNSTIFSESFLRAN